MFLLSVLTVTAALYCSTVSGTEFTTGLPVLKKSTVTEASNALLAKMQSTTNHRGDMIMIPGILRLAFHDCIDGCDACLNMDLDANKGLEVIIANLEEVYVNFTDKMSRADFWVLATQLAVDVGIDENNNWCNLEADQPCVIMDKQLISLNFQYGRRDCLTSPLSSSQVEYPDGSWDQDKIISFFRRHFGMTSNNAVALMGAHSVGRTKLENSGFDGVWDPKNVDGISSQYYTNIMDKTLGWEQVMNDAGKYQWTTTNLTARDPPLFALNSDMALVKDLIIIDEETGESSCTYETCKWAKGTKAMFASYGNDPIRWANNFQNQMMKVLKQGVALKSVKAD